MLERPLRGRRLPGAEDESGKGRPGWLTVAPYARIAGNPKNQAREVLERILDHLDREAVGARRRNRYGGQASSKRSWASSKADEFRTLSKAVELLLPSVRTLFEIGGESSRYVRFERHGANGRLGIADYRTNGDCAAGTGAFLDQQAGRLRFRVEDLGRIALATQRAAQIAGRCSVFAKSDMIHAQQRGFTPGGDPQRPVRCGRPQLPELDHQGPLDRAGRSRSSAAWRNNAGVVRALERAFGWQPGSLMVPADPASFGAIGAACLAHETRRVRRRAPDSAISPGRRPDGTVLPDRSAALDGATCCCCATA